MFLTGEDILAQSGRWKKQISNEIEDIETVNRLVEEVVVPQPDVIPEPSKDSQKPDPRAEDLRRNILIHPYPARAGGGEEPKDKSRIKGALCELTLGDQVYLASEEVPRKLVSSKLLIADSSPFVVIKPGEFAVLTAHEYIYVPTDVIGLISIRNRYKQKGLINVSGFHVDPGFRGRLIFTAYNAGPTEIVLKFREHLFMLTFAELRGDVGSYDKVQLEIPTESISALKGVSVSPKSLDVRVTRLEIIVTVVAVPLAVALIAALLRLI